jgi:hypothetical protein
LLLDRQRAGGVARRDVPGIAVDCSLADAGARFDGWELAAVVSDDGIVVGAVRAEAVSGSADVIVGEVMQTAPATVRPSISNASSRRAWIGTGRTICW